MSAPRIEDVETVVVGRFYDVPAIRSVHRKNNIWWPIMGPEHEDADIGVAQNHYHYDWRFVPARLYAEYGERRMGTVHNSQWDCEKGRIRRKCQRQTGEFPACGLYGGNKPLPWITRLEDQFAAHRLCGMICPHRGMPLKGHPAKDGIIICPGHGLRWRVEDGKLVRWKDNKASVSTPTQTPSAPKGGAL